MVLATESPFDIYASGHRWFPRLPSAGLIGRSRPTWTAPAGRVHRWARVAHGRTRMTVFPLIRSVGLKAATASSRVAMLL
jgi:hypothetical protein